MEKKESTYGRVIVKTIQLFLGKYNPLHFANILNVTKSKVTKYLKDCVLEWLAFHVSWMMFQYLLAEDTGIDMGINLSGTNILMAKQCLDDTQVGTSFE